MPKLKPLTAKIAQDEAFRTCCRRQMGEKDYCAEEVAQKIGIHRNTWTKRMQDPDSIKVCELRALSKVLGFNKQDICSMLGLKNE